MNTPIPDLYDDAALRRPSWPCRIWSALAMLLLLWPVSGGMYLLASTRTWSWSIGLVLAFTGYAMVFLRPVLFPREGFGWRIPWPWLGFAAVVAVLAAIYPRAFVPCEARWELLKWLCLCLAALAWCQCGGSGGERWKFFAFLLMLALSVECFYAISKHIDHSRAVLWMQRPDQYGMRASGTYLCPNHLANALAMGFPLALLLLFSSAAGAPLRLMAVYYLAVSAPVLYWTQSRSGWGGMLAGVAAAAVLAAWRKGGAKWLAIALVAVPLAGAAFGFGAWKALPAVRERIGAVIEDPIKAGGIRSRMWADVPAMLRDRPATGFGGGSFLWAYPPYRVHTDQRLTYDQLHNDPLQILVEYGAVGGALVFGLYLWTGILFAVRAVRSRDDDVALLSTAAAGALAASALHSLFDFNFHVFPNPHILVMLCGLALGRHAARAGGGIAVRGRIPAAALSAAAVVLCGAGLWYSLSGGFSYWWTLKGEASRSSLDLDYAASEACYRRAIRWQPSNWQPWLGLGDLQSTRAMWYRAPDPEAQAAGRRRLVADALDALAEAERLNPGDMAVEIAFARAESAAGNDEAALEHIRRAATYQHRHAYYREELGFQLLRMGREDEALAVFKQNIADKVASGDSWTQVRVLERRAAKRAKAATEAAPAN